MKHKWTYNETAANRPVRFIEGLIKHTQGEWSGRPFVLEQWQKEQIIYPAFGMVDANTGHRRYKFVYVELPKGNGKSYLLSAISLYLALGEGEQAAEIYCCAGDREQARIIFDTCRAMVEISPQLSAACEVYKNSIVHKKTKSVIKVISAEAYSKHGYRPQGIAFDELHVQPNRELYDTLTRGMIKRKNSMCWMITTAGVKNTFAETIHDYAERLARGSIKDDAWLPVIYKAEPDEDPFKPATWAKANPGYGSIIDPDTFGILAKEAQNQPSALNAFKRLHLNIWTGSVESWIPPHVWEKCSTPVDLARLRGVPCWGGLDLASTQDLSAFALLFETERDVRYDLLVWVFCPEDTLHDRTRKENSNYEAWAEAGLITATPGNVQDLESIKNVILDCMEKYNLQGLSYDPWNGDTFAADLYTRYNVPVRKCSQTLTSLSEPSKRFETLVTGGLLAHGGNPVLSWMMDNVQIYRDTNDNYRPHKAKSKGKIDGIMAAINAVAEMMDWKRRNETTIYNERDGILMI